MDMTEEKSATALLNQNVNDIKNSLPAEEIVSSTPSHKSWKGIVIAILVILFISGLIVLAIYLTSPELFHGGIKTNYGSKFSFMDFFLSRSLHKTLVYEWIGTDLLSYVNASEERLLLNMTSMTMSSLIWKTYIDEKSSHSSSCSLSVDGELLFIYYNLSANYRHSSTAQYSVFNMSDKSKNVEIGPSPQSPLQNAQWSPTGHTLAFVHKNNLYYTENPLDNSNLILVTGNLTQHQYISYGVADWLYEEEVLKESKAFWWSTKGNNIAFLSFDDQLVQNYKIKVYGGENELNGHFIDVQYPKAGHVPRAKNPVVNAFVYNLKQRKVYKIPIPKNIPKDYYICFVKWIDDEHLLTGWTNREQNEVWLSIAQKWTEKGTPDSWVIFQEKTSFGWINLLKQSDTEPIMFPKKQKIFIIQNRITRDTEYRNIAELSLFYTPKKVALKKWIITADFDFTDIIYFNGENTIYFSAVLHNDSKQLHLYKADIRTGHYECQSCNNPNCTYNNFAFNSDGRFAIHSCLGPSIPTYNLMKISKQGNLSFERTLINNTKLKEVIATRAMPKIEYQKIKLKLNSTHSIDLEAKVMLPVTLIKQHVTQYPLLLNVYAGPSSQAVTTKFSLDWSTYLVSSLNIINLQIDGRGTINRGRQFEKEVYKNMGKVEIHDQIKATEEFVSKSNFVNKSQIGAYGWSYGGFAVGHILGNPDNKLIRCGVSVAPVTSFDYYDTAYTERYLGLKEKNPLAYKQTDISNVAKYFAEGMNKKFLLIHGTKDDNVHFLNTAKLIRSLVSASFDFDVMVYPDEAHTLSGGRTHYHVFRKITTFLMNCYNKTSVENYIDLFQ